MQEPARAMEGFREKTGPGSVSMIARSTTAQETFRLGPGGLPGSTSTASKASSITCSVMVSSALRILLWPLTLITVVNVSVDSTYTWVPIKPITAALVRTWNLRPGVLCRRIQVRAFPA